MNAGQLLVRGVVYQRRCTWNSVLNVILVVNLGRIVIVCCSVLGIRQVSELLKNVTLNTSYTSFVINNHNVECVVTTTSCSGVVIVNRLAIDFQ